MKSDRERVFEMNQGPVVETLVAYILWLVIYIYIYIYIYIVIYINI
eukprot:gene1284-737_t